MKTEDAKFGTCHHCTAKGIVHRTEHEQQIRRFRYGHEFVEDVPAVTWLCAECLSEDGPEHGEVVS